MYDSILSKNGTIIFEEPYLGSMYKKISYDQIYDEHIYMFSVCSIKKFINYMDLKLIDAIPSKYSWGIHEIHNKKSSQIITKKVKDY
jgi:methylation protein EvaC